MKLKKVWLLVLSCLFSLQLIAYLIRDIQDSITVYVFLHESCVISQFYPLELGELYEECADDNLNFVGLFPNVSSKPEQIQAFQDTYGIPFEL
ncbi:MAG: hypothetical protein AAGA10_28455 [Bacteroidota bacterium]